MNAGAPSGRNASAPPATSPRARVAVCLIFVATVSLLQSWPALLLAFSMAVIAARRAGWASTRLARRLLWLLPFSGFMILTLPLVTPGEPAWLWQVGWLRLAPSRDGLLLAGSVSARVVTSALAVLALVTTTPFPRLLAALQAMRVPPLLVALAGMTVRYIEVLRDEARRLVLARRSRCFRPGRNLWDRHTLRTTAATIGMLFVRAQSRSERIYWAMLARGYTVQRGPHRAAPMAHGEVAVIALAVTAAVILVIVDRTVHGV